jgi:glutamyl-tRNA reductase
LNNFKIIAFTHKTIGLDAIGKLHLQDDVISDRLTAIKQHCGLNELMYLSTCNRVEFLIVHAAPIDKTFLVHFFSAFNPSWDIPELNRAAENALVWEGEQALDHLFNVAASLDSLVVGEREIITQVRNAYENCKQLGLTGDLIRIIVKRTIETAKQVYTQTDVARNPVSVVSLAYRKLKELNVKLDARFIIVGSGITNTTMAKYLKKHGFKNFVVFNRTLAHAQKLAVELNAKSYPLTELKNYTDGFDVILTCTGSAESIINKTLYKALIGNDNSKKIVIDLAVPNDVDAEVLNSFDINLIAVNNLQDIANKNLAEREKELDKCKQIVASNISGFRQILKTRKIELAMSEVPKKVKEIHDIAINQVFAKDIETLDAQSKEVLNKILSYVEKKYISVPMKMAKDILSEEIKN